MAHNDFRAADLRFDQVQRLTPAKPDGFYWGGCVAAHQASFPRAEWLFSAALERAPDDASLYRERATLAETLGMSAAALSDFEKAFTVAGAPHLPLPKPASKGYLPRRKTWAGE